VKADPGVALIDSMGADRLLGADDMLFIAPGSAKLRRLHGSLFPNQDPKNL